jgi:hypothetical protein
MFIVRNENYGFVVAYALAIDAYAEARRLTRNSRGGHIYRVCYEPRLQSEIGDFDLTAHLNKRRKNEN